MAPTTREYIIVLKAYIAVPQEEIPLVVIPPELLNDKECLPVGIHSFVWTTTEKNIEDFAEKIFKHPDLKIIGVHFNTNES